MFACLIRFTFPVLFLVLFLGAYRLLGKSMDRSQLTLERRQPRSISHRREVDPRIVSDEQLFAVLDRLQPPTEWTNTNVLLHAFRLWGPLAEFNDDRVPSGERLRQYFLDDAAFRKLAGSDAPPLYRIDAETGQVHVRDWSPADPDRVSSSYHLNDILATLAETGTSLDTALRTRDGDTTVERLLDTAMGQMHFRQHEFEWSAISYARYVYPESGWRNDYGERITAAEVVRELVGPLTLTYGPCNGLHRLEAMVVLWGADQELGPATSRGDERARQRLRDPMLRYMRQVVALLEVSQHVDGYWTRAWPAGQKARTDENASLSDHILVTCHHLEWLALAPPELDVPNEMVVRATQWVVRAIQEVDDQVLRRGYGPFSHAVRALCLWRSKDPYEAWRQYKGQQKSAADPA